MNIDPDFDSDMLGFVVSIIGMAVCVVGAALWSCLT